MMTMHISIICIPYQIDVTRWGVALGPQAFLDHGLIQLLEAKAWYLHTDLAVAGESPSEQLCLPQVTYIW
jgi:thiamine transporter ThiT